MKRSNNSEVIIELCCHLSIGEGIKPLGPAEYSKLAEQLYAIGATPADLLGFTRQDFSNILNYSDVETDRLFRLFDRSASLAFEVARYEKIGIDIVTRADSGVYPKCLKKKIGNTCPPMLFVTGNSALFSADAVGFAGSRSIDEKDIAFTNKMVEKVVANGFSVVTGGAKEGVDNAASQEAIALGTSLIEYLPGTMLQRLKDRNILGAVQNGKAVLASPYKPDAGFDKGNAMGRNKLVYAQSVGTIIVKSDFDKGGTWNGAIENIKHKYSTTFCWERPNIKGNTELIKAGAIPISEDWDGNPYKELTHEAGTIEQMCLFS